MAASAELETGSIEDPEVPDGPLCSGRPQAHASWVCSHSGLKDCRTNFRAGEALIGEGLQKSCRALELDREQSSHSLRPPPSIAADAPQLVGNAEQRRHSANPKETPNSTSNLPLRLSTAHPLICTESSSTISSAAFPKTSIASAFPTSLSPQWPSSCSPSEALKTASCGLEGGGAATSAAAPARGCMDSRIFQTASSPVPPAAQLAQNSLPKRDTNAIQFDAPAPRRQRPPVPPEGQERSAADSQQLIHPGAPAQMPDGSVALSASTPAAPPAASSLPLPASHHGVAANRGEDWGWHEFHASGATLGTPEESVVHHSYQNTRTPHRILSPEARMPEATAWPISPLLVDAPSRLSFFKADGIDSSSSVDREDGWRDLEMAFPGQGAPQGPLAPREKSPAHKEGRTGILEGAVLLGAPSGGLFDAPPCAVRASTRAQGGEVSELRSLPHEGDGGVWAGSATADSDKAGSGNAGKIATRHSAKPRLQAEKAGSNGSSSHFSVRFLVDEDVDSGYLSRPRQRQRPAPYAFAIGEEGQTHSRFRVSGRLLRRGVNQEQPGGKAGGRAERVLAKLTESDIAEGQRKQRLAEPMRRRLLLQYTELLRKLDAAKVDAVKNQDAAGDTFQQTLVKVMLAGSKLKALQNSGSWREYMGASVTDVDSDISVFLSNFGTDVSEVASQVDAACSVANASTNCLWTCWKRTGLGGVLASFLVLYLLSIAAVVVWLQLHAETLNRAAKNGGF
ncbi:transmembrane protein [Cyclospora cayetanensis]|uniref:Transmembrane protein n=1 Tax=Cyclospora cayetanensis TaxID=88456 RepID=A0A1D3D733_9EIME|nr:transmembrane protein [Cyclospora cayetanensis]